MNIEIRPYETKYIKDIVALSLRAWEPVFRSIKENMDREIYEIFYPDWRQSQKEAVEHVCGSDETRVWVAFEEETVTGFAALKLGSESKTGEIYMVAVDPDHQGKGICSSLVQFALKHMKEEGMTVATVSTGTDPGHAPARRCYERMGFSVWPVAMYLKKL